MTHSVNVTADVGYSPPDFIAYSREIAARGLREHLQASWATDASDLRASLESLEGVEVKFRRRNRHADTIVFSIESEALVRLELADGNITIDVSANEQTTVDGYRALLEEAFPKAEASETDVPITFWSYSPHGPRAIARRIAVPRWETIAVNYTHRVRNELASMMTDFRPSHGGQLVLWQGEPGTGKTWALRALASEWRDWAEFHYITDPEVFFGERADYMLGVLLHDGEMTAPVVAGQPASGDALQHWNVLILEDTGELLAADAKERTGQALSRLLNVVDGLIGQGLRILVLVTTNEELRRLHPAVSRPGRCAARIEFTPLQSDEAREWLLERGGSESPDAATLAELYARIEGFEREARTSIGFRLGGDDE